MQSAFTINPELDIPIYQQLVDAIRAAVKKGDLAPREQLPTVQLLSQTLGVARGTVKRAYDELERDGILEKVQGRGTFVCYQPASSGSNKEQAMAAIDDLLERLEKMGFSPAEINIFVNLKLRERWEQGTPLRIALMECNPENLTYLTDQLRNIAGIELFSFLLETVQQYPYKLEENFDLIVTTAEHASYLHSVLPTGKKMIRVALRMVPECMSQLIKLRRGNRVGILGYSQRFVQLLLNTCQTYADDVLLQQPMLFSQVEDMGAYLRGLDAVLIPKNYQRYCSAEAICTLNQFAGKRIACSYEMDEGSSLYLQEKIRRLLEERKV